MMIFKTLAFVSICSVWFAMGLVTAAEAPIEAPIDALLAESHREYGIQPTPTCDDRTFLRRISLDLLGRVPTEQEIRRFDSSGDRAGAIDRLLMSEEFPRYWSQLWATILVGRGNDGRSDREALRQWLEQQFSNRKPLDQIAFDLIAAEGVTTLDGPVNFIVANREDPVTPVSRIFLGVQLDCARCHDHPDDRWSQDDYQAMRRFFRPIQIQEVSGGVRLGDRGAVGREADDAPRFLTGSRPATNAWRRELALMTVRCKPFARALGNRVWQLLMGRGIVDPVDGLSENHRPSVPALHQALADQLVAQQFDLRNLVRTICTSQAYSRTEGSQSSVAEREQAFAQFAARRPRPLTPEQLIASYHQITDGAAPSPQSVNRTSIEFLGSALSSAGAEDPIVVRRTSQGLLQELATETPSPSGSIDSIFLSTLTRRPDDWEREHLADVSAEDLLYALLHCNEFVFCH